MSQENVEIVQRAFAAFSREGPEALASFWDPENGTDRIARDDGLDRRRPDVGRTGTAHQPSCVETVNPYGQNVPPAGSTT
jgi:hypothetical protein